MSLFGTSPEAGSQDPQTRSIFGADLTPAAGNSTTSSLFNDDGPTDSPWSMPTPKRNARQNLVKNLLPANDVPESYIDAYDTILNSGERTGSGLSLTAVKSILSSSNLTATDQERISGFILSGDQGNFSGLGRSEFNVLLALIGLAQEGEDVTLDGVDERRRSK